MKKTLQKVIDELSKDAPRLDYVRGILETLVDGEETTILPVYPSGISNTFVPMPSHNELNDAERAIMMAEQGFIKGTMPGTVESNVILK